MRYPFLDLSAVNAPDLAAMEAAACDVIRSGYYLRGPQTAAFESELAAIHGEGMHAIAVSNGLDALRLILRAYLELGRLKPGDEVLYPANTYIASVLPISELGLRPVAVEPDPATMNIDLSRIEGHLTARTKAIMLVHLYGNPCWDSTVMNKLRDSGILVIEDNAQAIGARAAEEGFNGSHLTGALGDAAGFSFYPTKNIGALGDAGAVMTSDKTLADTVRALANYGSDTRYHNIYRGYNCRMDELQAAMLRVRLRRLDEIIENRNAAADVYSRSLTLPQLILPSVAPGDTHVWHQYVVRHPRRDRLREYLKENGVGTDIHYAIPPHRQPCYADTDFGPLPVADRLAETVVSLPIAAVSPTDAAEIAEIINGFSE